MQISFHEWEDSPLTHRAVASLGSDEVQVWIATAPSDEASLTALACQLSPDERALLVVLAHQVSGDPGADLGVDVAHQRAHPLRGDRHVLLGHGRHLDDGGRR